MFSEMIVPYMLMTLLLDCNRAEFKLLRWMSILSGGKNYSIFIVSSFLIGDRLSASQFKLLHLTVVPILAKASSSGVGGGGWGAASDRHKNYCPLKKWQKNMAVYSYILCRLLLTFRVCFRMSVCLYACLKLVNYSQYYTIFIG